jgi:alkylhydroperoxidase family enzyme
MTARIAPVPPTGNAPDIQELLDFGTEGTGGASNVFLTLARNPELFRGWMAFTSDFYTPTALAPRHRELLILRTAWRCGSDYEWGQHVRMAHAAGLTDAEITAVTGDIDAAAWSATDAALLQTVDELIDDHTVAPSTWAALARDFDEAHLIEVLLLVGSYIGLAGFLNAVGVEREAGVSGLPTTHQPTTGQKEKNRCLA